MLFNSFAFLLFFPIVTILYFVLPHKIRWLLILFASCFFYAFFKIEYLLILVFTIIVDYTAGIYIEQSQDAKNKKWFLIASLIANIGILAVFKYYNFLNGNITSICQLLGVQNDIPFLKIILPIGLSFHTFQAMSYTIEVYRGKQKAERHFGIYALYVMYYPQLVAGPIERPQNLLHQFYEPKTFDYQRVTDGLKLMAWGFFKKIVIADRLAEYVNQFYHNPESYYGIQVFIFLIMFSYQIYCDFSGYSDIALGASMIMGIKLMENFRTPYYSKNISEFWSRWHISLSTWFRDYLYIPLGGNRVSKNRWYFNLFVVFTISGLWHGANWTFIVWGAIHAFLLVSSLLLERGGINLNKMLPSWFNMIITFLLVTFAWIFFRAETFSKATLVIGNLCHHWSFQFKQFGFELKEAINNLLYLGRGQDNFLILVLALLFLELIQLSKRGKNVFYFFQGKPAWLRWSFYVLLISFITVFGLFHSGTEFIYFQF